MNRRLHKTGFTLVEVLICLAIFSLMVLLFGASTPVLFRSSQLSNRNSQAVQLVQHKIDQMRAAGYDGLTRTTLIERRIIDSTSTQPAATNVAHSYSFTSADGLVDVGSTKGTFPPGTVGTITIEPFKKGTVPVDATVTPSSTFNPGSCVVQVTAKIDWPSSSGKRHVISATALIIQMNHR